MSGFTYDVMTEEDVEEASICMGRAFAFPPEDSRTWMTKTGIERFRVLRDETKRLCGTALLVDMGIYFGGRSVPMTGVAGVTVAPDARGRGVGLALMRDVVREMKDAGAPLSALYASTQPIYRKVGYEQAGHWCKTTVETQRIDVRADRESALRIREITEDDTSRVHETYKRWAKMADGHLDRGDYIWNRVTSPRFGKSDGWLVEDERGNVHAYAYLRQEKSDAPDDGRHHVVLTDFIALDGAGAHALWDFLGSFRSMGHTVSFSGAPTHPLLLLLGEHRFQIMTREFWFLRVVDVRTALAMRGYAPGLNAELHLDVTDDLIDDNNGAFVLRIADGVASVEPGGRGDLRLDVRSLAPLYTGFHSPRQLASVGRIKADEAAIRTAAGVFPGGIPAMPDMF